MCFQNIHSETVSGKDLNDYKVRQYYESIMEPIVFQEFHRHIDLEPHVSNSDLSICFYDCQNRIKLFIPLHLSFSIEQLLEEVRKKSKEEAPALLDLFSSSECTSNGIATIRAMLNQK